MGSSSKWSKVPNPVNICDHVIPSAFYSMSPMFGRVISFPRISIGLKQKYEYPYISLSQSTAQKSAAHVRTPSVTSPEPLPKRPENPSEATAVVVGRVHRGPRRDQLLDHGGLAFLSRKMQRRLASGAGDATRTAGQLRLPSRNKAIVMGCFSGWLGKKMWIGHTDRRW